MKKTLGKIFECILVTVLFGGIAFGMNFYMTHRESDAKARQSTEEDLAEEYLIHALEEESYSPAESEVVIHTETENETADAEHEETSKETSGETHSEETPVLPYDPFDYTDDVYHVRDGQLFTPDYAAGTLAAVLEIPCIELRRGVYTGTYEQIMHDLDVWMTVTSRPDYVLGETQYTIYGHNYPVENLSFNRLKDVKPGDYFLLTNDKGVWFYEVIDFFADWRESVTRNIVDNFDLPKENCYILSCGRDEYRYKDIVVTGTLKGRYSLKEWKAREAEILSEYEPELKKVYEDWLKKQENEKKKEKFSFLMNTLDPEDIVIHVDAPESLKGRLSLALFDADGIVVTDERGEEYLYVWNGDDIHVRGIPDGEYVFGVVEIDEEGEAYRIPEDQVLVKSEQTLKQKPVSEIRPLEYVTDEMPIQYWKVLFFGLAVFGWFICLLLILLPKKKKNVQRQLRYHTKEM